MHDGDDSVEAFTDDLREMWIRAGRPSFSSLAAKTHLSRTSLNDAMRRTDRLPSETVLSSLVEELESGSSQRWEQRRSDLAVQLSRAPGRGRAAPEDEQITEKHSTPRSNITWLTSGAVVGAVVASAVWWAATLSDTSETTDQAVNTGDDPANTACVDDARIVGALDEDGFTVEIVFSPACNAAWGRIARHDDQGHGNRIEVAIYDRDDPDGPSRQQAVEPDIAGAYTMLIVKDSPVQRLCVEGAAFTDGEGVHSDPVCS